VPRLPQSKWVLGSGIELGKGVEYPLPTAGHYRMSPGAWERVTRSLDMSSPMPSLTFNPSFQGPHTEGNKQPLLLVPGKQTYSSGSPQRRH
jgi:hypothetical protein